MWEYKSVNFINRHAKKSLIRVWNVGNYTFFFSWKSGGVKHLINIMPVKSWSISRQFLKTIILNFCVHNPHAMSLFLKFGNMKITKTISLISSWWNIIQNKIMPFLLFTYFIIVIVTIIILPIPCVNFFTGHKFVEAKYLWFLFVPI